jgi:hypothetical protein
VLSANYLSAESNNVLPQPQLLMGLLSTTPSADIPSILKFIYNREITGIMEYLKIYVCWSTNNGTYGEVSQLLFTSDGSLLQPNSSLGVCVQDGIGNTQ